ncbi:sugar phosphate isomerase/epimerase family protein [Aestuariimicrobium ganziense]|uniref:sugar phosphate isomerase/epimerase family protein n=1 Tax=Aestuariimicrobium ganziense TaxID=2773677 RepID=UPI0019437BDB|nr:sugar phosphate isomerase/epimerase [Aestuariimicrobium ganziense]
MATIGSMMMMFKTQVAEQGLYPVLEQIRALGYDAVEYSQMPTDEEHIAQLERGVNELGLQVGALSVVLKGQGNGISIADEYDWLLEVCRRLGTKFVRIGMMPFDAMATKERCEAWATECEQAAQKLKADGIQLCYHNHHVDLAQFDGERIFDIVRRVAPTVHFEVDLHWVQRGGMNPIDMLKAYEGVCDLIHLKDYRVRTLPPDALEMLADPERRGEFMKAFQADTIQYAEVGQGNMNWPAILPVAEQTGASFLFVEQDDVYGRDPFDCIRESREYLRSIGW